MSPRTGHLTGVIGVRFISLQLPGGREQSIRGVLASLGPKANTTGMVETVFIGHSSGGRASTLVGNSDDYARSGLGAPEAMVVAGTRITMELAEALTLTDLPTALRSKVAAVRVVEPSASAATRR